MRPWWDYPRASQCKDDRLHPAVTFERPRNLDADYIHLGGTVQPGLSGAPVFNSDGELVGVVIALFAGETGMGCAVRAEHVARFLGR